MKRPQFTIWDLMRSTALIASSIGIILAAQRFLYWPYRDDFVFCCMLFSGSLLGAGVLLPFGKAKTGAVCGLIMAAIVIFAIDAWAIAPRE